MSICLLSNTMPSSIINCTNYTPIPTCLLHVMGHSDAIQNHRISLSTACNTTGSICSRDERCMALARRKIVICNRITLVHPQVYAFESEMKPSLLLSEYTREDTLKWPPTLWRPSIKQLEACCQTSMNLRF